MKKEYNIKEVAVILNKCEETVRRYIRNNKIKASYSSRKKGYIIKEKDLLLFITLKNNKKKENKIKYLKERIKLLKKQIKETEKEIEKIRKEA